MSGPLADSDSQSADGDAAPYHALTPWAVAALFLGLLSPLALASPVLWLLPLVCMVFSFAAMRKISASHGELVGWNIALLGLLMALLFGVAAPVHTLTRHRWIEIRSEEFATQFLDLLRQGRTQAAYQLSINPARRKPLDFDFTEQFAQDPKAREKFDEFLQIEPARTLSATGQQAKIEHLDSQWLAGNDENDQVAVRYRIGQPGDSAAVPFNIRLLVLRFVDGKTGRELWQIGSAKVVE